MDDFGSGKATLPLCPLKATHTPWLKMPTAPSQAEALIVPIKRQLLAVKVLWS